MLRGTSLWGARQGDQMKSLLLVAFVSLLRAVWASEPPAAKGFYLNNELISMQKACAILFNPENFQELPGLSVVAPLSVEDTAVLVQAVVPQVDSIIDLENSIWHAWISALQLPEEHPTVEHCKTLYAYLVGAIRVIRNPHLKAVGLGPCKPGPNHHVAYVELQFAMPDDPFTALLLSFMLAQRSSERSAS